MEARGDEPRASGCGSGKEDVCAREILKEELAVFVADSSDQNGGELVVTGPCYRGEAGFGKKTKNLFRHLVFAEAAAGLCRGFLDGTPGQGQWDSMRRLGSPSCPCGVGHAPSAGAPLRPAQKGGGSCRKACSHRIVFASWKQTCSRRKQTNNPICSILSNHPR